MMPTQVPEAVQAELRRVGRLDPATVAQELAKMLGLRLTAAIGGVKETRRVREWIERGSGRRSEALKAALQAAAAIASVYDAAAARAWFTSANPALGMRSPIVFLRNVSDIEDFDRLVATAVQDI